MFDFLKKLNAKQASFLGFLLVIGIGMFIIGLFNLPYIITGKADDLNEMVMAGEEPSNLEIVELDVKYVLEIYAWSESGYRSMRTDKFHYLVMLEDGSCISLVIKQNDTETVNSLAMLMSATSSYLSGYSDDVPETVHITAVAKSLKGEKKNYYVSAAHEYGFATKDILMYELDTSKTRGALTAMLVIGVLLIIAGIMYLRQAANDKKAKARSFAALENDINNDPLRAFNNRNLSEADDKTDNEFETNTISYQSNISQSSDASNTASTSKFTLKKD